MTSDPPCFICKNPRSSRCSGCANTRYCSTACQKKDWKTHKLVCKAFADAGPRPSSDHFRALLFPDHTILLRFVWAEYTDTAAFTTINTHEFIGEVMDGALYMDRFPRLKERLNLEHNIGVYHKDCFVHEPVTMSVWLMLRAVGLSPGGR